MRIPLLVLALGVVGCGPPTPYLRWAMAPPAPSLQGRVILRDVVNKRDEKHGARDPGNVGNIRNGFGVPYPVRIDGGGGGWEGSIEPRTMAQSIGELVAGGVQSAGVGLVPPTDPQPTSHLWVEVLELWCDGYVGYSAAVSLQLVIVDPQTQAPRMRVPVRQEGGASNCRNAFANALNGAQQQIASAFMRPDVRGAALAAGSPPVAMPAGAPPVMPAVGSCPTGKTVGADTQGHCCWPGQVFAASRNSCVGMPQSCPPGTHAAGEECTP
jgi:hypothetical protein